MNRYSQAVFLELGWHFSVCLSYTNKQTLHIFTSIVIKQKKKKNQVNYVNVNVEIPSGWIVSKVVYI